MFTDDYQPSAPFEGPEKLLEIWFAPSANHVPHQENAQNHKSGLRSVRKQIWEEMLNIVQCKVLSVIQGQEMDAYLLRSGIHLKFMFFFFYLGILIRFQRIFLFCRSPSTYSQDMRHNSQSPGFTPHSRNCCKGGQSTRCIPLLLFPKILYVSGTSARPSSRLATGS